MQEQPLSVSEDDVYVCESSYNAGAKQILKIKVCRTYRITSPAVQSRCLEPGLRPDSLQANGDDPVANPQGSQENGMRLAPWYSLKH